MASWIRGSNPSTNRGVRANEQAEKRHIRSSSGCNKDKEARPDGRRLDAFEKKQDAMLGLAIVILLILMVIFAGVLFDYDTVVIKQDISQRLQSPSGFSSLRH